MTIKVYVNHDKEEVITEKEFRERVISDEIKSIRCPDAFSEWLTDEKSLTPAEIFYLTKEEKEKMEQEYEEYLTDIAIDNLEQDRWDWIELEV